jgi:hypothetical protein
MMLRDEVAVLKNKCASMVRLLEHVKDENRLRSEALKESQAAVLHLRTELAAEQSKEVCTQPHSDEVMEFCAFCKIEAYEGAMTEICDYQDDDAEHFRAIACLAVGRKM